MVKDSKYSEFIKDVSDIFDGDISYKEEPKTSFSNLISLENKYNLNTTEVLNDNTSLPIEVVRYWESEYDTFIYMEGDDSLINHLK